MRNFTLLNCLLFYSLVVGQPSATEESEIIKAYQIKNQLIQNSRVKNVNFKNIGPTIMSGRVVALEVNPDDPTEFYVAYASGGVWHTINNGTSFNPISEEWPTQNIGEITMDWKNGTLWVGTGENNASRSAKLRFATRSEESFFYPKEMKKKFYNYLELENRNV